MYNEYKQNGFEQKQSLSEYVYDYMNFKYGLKQVAEKKFTQLLISCRKNKSIFRINLFARFLELYDDLPPTALGIYLNVADQVLSM